jgi:hypothetical protein
MFNTTNGNNQEMADVIDMEHNWVDSIHRSPGCIISFFVIGVTQ